MIPRVQRALFEGIAILDGMGLRYAVVGGLAVGVWAVPRATRDVDLYVELPVGKREQLRAELVAQGFDVPAMAEELARFGVFRSKLLSARVFVDIFDATGPLGEAILDRRKSVSTESREIWFASPEDLALLKAFSDRPRDQEDLATLLAVSQDTMDLGYIERWVKQLDQSIGGNDVSERLRLARDEATRRRKKET